MTSVFVLGDRSGGLHGVFRSKLLAEEKRDELHVMASIEESSHWTIMEFELMERKDKNSSGKSGCHC